MEFGSIKGRGHRFSLSTNSEKTVNGEMDTYLVTVRFEDGMMTNYGSTIDATQEAKGQAEIIVNDRKLIMRFFDNLKYVMNE